jgi:hypothetical protein
MRRREFIAGLGAVAASPGSARAQQATMPVVGFLSSASRDQDAGRLRAFHEGLAETGYVEGRNVAVEDRWADEQNERLPQLAADLVNRRVDVIATSGHVLAVFAGPWQRRAIEQAARQLEVKLQVIEMRPEFDPVFAEVRAERVQGLVFLSSPVVSRYAARWTALASAAGLPTISLFQSSPMPEDSWRTAPFHSEVAPAARNDLSQGYGSFAGFARKMRARFTDQQVVQADAVAMAHVARLSRELPSTTSALVASRRRTARPSAPSRSPWSSWQPKSKLSGSRTRTVAGAQRPRLPIHRYGRIDDVVRHRG